MKELLGTTLSVNGREIGEIDRVTWAADLEPGEPVDGWATYRDTGKRRVDVEITLRRGR